jgi:hypothetical protein
MFRGIHIVWLGGKVDIIHCNRCAMIGGKYQKHQQIVGYNNSLALNKVINKVDFTIIMI